MEKVTDAIAAQFPLSNTPEGAECTAQEMEDKTGTVRDAAQLNCVARYNSNHLAHVRQFLNLKSDSSGAKPSANNAPESPVREAKLLKACGARAPKPS